MRIAIFSDVHSNINALEAVLADIKRHDVEMYVCLGDVVGYGADPDRCCTIVRNLVKYCVLGNHDAAVAGRMDYEYYYDAARNALDHHAATVSDDNRDWLRALPYTVLHDDICFSHGSPINVENFDYVFNPVQAASLLPHWDQLASVTFIGHSHLVKSFSLLPPGPRYRVDEVTADQITFLKDRKYIVTVGSVGQPRDNDARACYTIYDTDTRTIHYHRVDYDVAGSARRILDDEHLSPDFGKRLFLGI